MKGFFQKVLEILCLTFFLTVHPAISGDPTLNDDVLGLIVFKADLHDPHSTLVSWTEDDDSPCKWFGVRCNPRTGEVIELALDGLGLSGKLGQGLARLQSLRKLTLSKNNLTGTVNPDLAALKSLKIVDLSENALSGMIPSQYFENCSSLRTLSLAYNAFSGRLPASMSSCLTLSELNLSSNSLSGDLPAGIWSLTALRSLDLSQNQLTGVVLPGINALNDLRVLDLSENKFSGVIPADISRCSFLKYLDLRGNSFSGTLSDSLQGMSALNVLQLGRNGISGDVPVWIGELKNLDTLDLSGNAFSGLMPDSIGLLLMLKSLNLSNNEIAGGFPGSLKNCRNLSVLDLSRNKFSGELPAWVFGMGLSMESGTGKVGSEGVVPVASESGSLEFLDISDNGFSGVLPSEIGFSTRLTLLRISENSLSGYVPESVGDLKLLKVLDFSKNQLNGSVPSTLGKCSSLTSLILSHNILTGPIPTGLANLSELQVMDISFNNLSGQIPDQLGNLSNLRVLNITNNNFEGDLPLYGIFSELPPSDFAGNPALCVSRVNQSCPPVLPKPIVLNPNSTGGSSSSASSSTASSTFDTSQTHRKIILSISTLVAISAAAAITIGVITVTVLNLRVKNVASDPNLGILESLSGSPSTDGSGGAGGAYGKLVMFSGDGDFCAGTHALLNKDTELGRGGFGTVYRTVLRDGSPVAIKKLTVSSLVKSQEDFEKEVRKLGKICHPNLVQLKGYYWTPQLQLLIYEYVSGGSLYSLLHEGEDCNFLTWSERFDIILGIAKGLEHLHQSCRPPVIHYNLKASNVLIGAQTREAKVSDFGLAKLLPMLDRYVLSSKIQSALGYMAPEFACQTVKINEKCDVYGFGVLILEVITGKRPVEYMEDDVVVLIDVVRRALDEGSVGDWVDPRMGGKSPIEEVIPVVKLGLICTSQLPSNRPAMGEVVHILELIQCPSADSREEV